MPPQTLTAPAGRLGTSRHWWGEHGWADIRLWVSGLASLVRDLGARVGLTGADDERPLVEAILAHVKPWTRARITTAAGSLAFPAFCALIEAANVVVTNNTGPMHMAAALDTPVVALFALTNPPEQWGPWRVPHRMLWHEVPCRLCYSRVCPTTHDCLREVHPRDVVQAAADLLAESGQHLVGDNQSVLESLLTGSRR